MNPRTEAQAAAREAATEGRPASSSGRRWRSRRVPLKVLGSAGAVVAVGLGGCSEPTYQRNLYRSMPECIADYSTAVCARANPAPGSIGTAGGSRYVLGPVYRLVDGRPQACRSTDPGGGRDAKARLSTERLMRGGFGVACQSDRRRRWRSS